MNARFGHEGPRGPRNDWILIRMADEGIPINAIVRIAQRPAADVGRVLAEAQHRGELACLPAHNWPDRPDQRPPALDRDDELVTEVGGIVSALMRLYFLTEQQALVVGALVIRGEASRPTLLRLASSRSATQSKLLDVVMHHARSKLQTFELQVKTVWGRGYALSRADRERIQAEIADLRSSDRARRASMEACAC